MEFGFSNNIFCATLDRMGMTEIGHKSERDRGWDIFGTGVATAAVKHDAGTSSVKKALKYQQQGASS